MVPGREVSAGVTGLPDLPERGICFKMIHLDSVMVEEILSNLYRVEIPLPGSPLGTVNSYVVKSDCRSLIVDTGMDREECKVALQRALEEIDVDLKKTDFFITHLHLDHLGLVFGLKTGSSKVFFSRLDAEQVGSETEWDMAIQFALLHGFRADELQNVLSNHPGYRFKRSQLQKQVLFEFVREGQEIRIGNYLFRVIETPGHSRGHMCLYEPLQKILISGDHLLREITPTIQLWSKDGDPLRQYLSSLDKIETLEVERVLPGHGPMFRDCKRRIQELRHHHQKRAEEIIALLDQGGQNAYQLASRMSWDVDYGPWDSFPVLQKWFTVGETLAHLKYLEGEGKTRRQMRNQQVKFLLI